jgi:hypothetical protein
VGSTSWMLLHVGLLVQMQNMDLMEFAKIVILIVAYVQEQAQQAAKNVM